MSRLLVVTAVVFLAIVVSFVPIFFSRYCIVLGMSRSLVVTAVVFLAILVVDSKVLAKGTEGDYHLDGVGYGPGSLTSYECPKQCSRRCRRTQYKKPCLVFCNKCCTKCLCVPPGFYGNKSVCPCYSNWKTKNGGPRCP